MAIFKDTNKFNKINFKKSLSGSSIYKTSNPAGIENEDNYFGIKMRAFTEAISYRNSYIPNNYTVPLNYLM